MYKRYDDILSRVTEPPRWWCNGVPRYKEFAPNDLERAKEALLVRVECQNCGTPFIMGVAGKFDYDSKNRERTFENAIRTRRNLWVGDPPNVCCTPGNSMTVIEKEIIEFWRLDMNTPPYWFRLTELEGPAPDEH